MLRTPLGTPAVGRPRLARLAALMLLGLVFGGCDTEPAISPALSDAPPPSIGEPTLTEAGLYRVVLTPRVGAPSIGPLQEWVVRVENADGSAFEPVRIVVDGGMPQHRHGFVTTPRVTRALGPGRFLVEGVKFHMGGDWVMRVELVGASGPDVASFDVHVGP